MISGADLSSYSIALVALGEDTARSAKFTIPEKHRRDRAYVARSLRVMAEDWLKTVHTTHLFIEEPLVAGARNLRSSLLIAQVCGALLSAAGMERVYLVPVASWKKAVVGHGNASKEDVVRTLDTAHPSVAACCGGDQDLYDAAAVALHGAGLVQRSGQLNGQVLGDASPAGLARGSSLQELAQGVVLR